VQSNFITQLLNLKGIKVTEPSLSAGTAGHMPRIRLHKEIAQRRKFFDVFLNYGISYILSFMAGTNKTGEFAAIIVVESMSSAIPPATFPMILAVAGATTIRSASAPGKHAVCPISLAPQTCRLLQDCDIWSGR